MTRRHAVLVVVTFLGLAIVRAGAAPDLVPVGHAQTAGWSVRAVLPVPVTGAAASVGMDGKIYIFGGNTFAQSVTNAEVFDPATNTVTPIAPLPVGLSFMSATLDYDGKIYIAGGWEGSETTGQSVGTFLAYDPATNTYACSFSGPGCASSNLAPLLLPVSEEGVAAGLDGLIYVVGGFATAPTNMVQLYDPTKNVWYQGSNYPAADAGLRAVVSPGGMLYAGLGFDGQNYVNAIHYTATWGAGSQSRQAWIRGRQVSGPGDLGWDQPTWHANVPPPSPFPPWLPNPGGILSRLFDNPPPGPIERSAPVSSGGAKYAGIQTFWDGPHALPKPVEGIKGMVGRSHGMDAAHLSPLDQTYFGTDPADLYVMGGETNGAVSSAVSVYHLATRSWDTGPSLPNPTEDATTATANGVVYLIGGDNGTRPSSAILGYNAPSPPGPIPNPPTPTAAPSATATNTPAPPPTNTPVPLSARVSVAHRSVKAGQRQTITVQTEPSASIAITIAFPSGRKLRHSGLAGASGRFAWHFKEPKGAARGRTHTVKVTVKVTDASGQTATARTHFSA